MGKIGLSVPPNDKLWYCNDTQLTNFNLHLGCGYISHALYKYSLKVTLEVMDTLAF